MLNQLVKHTSMQVGFSMIFLALFNGQPNEMCLVQAIQYFVDHRIDVVRRRTASPRAPRAGRALYCARGARGGRAPR